MWIQRPCSSTAASSAVMPGDAYAQPVGTHSKPSAEAGWKSSLFGAFSRPGYLKPLASSVPAFVVVLKGTSGTMSSPGRGTHVPVSTLKQTADGGSGVGSVGNTAGGGVGGSDGDADGGGGDGESATVSGGGGGGGGGSFAGGGPGADGSVAIYDDTGRPADPYSSGTIYLVGSEPPRPAAPVNVKARKSVSII